jgi:pyruvate kinase
VFDGTSAVMLSGETAIGRDPVRVIATMDRIARRADEAFDSYQWGRAIGQEQSVSATGAPINRRITGAISAAGWRAAMDADVAAIIACTGTGATPRAISRFRPTAPILAATPSERVARELTVAWGIEAMVVDRRTTTDGTVSAAVTAALRAGHIHSGDLVAVLVGAPEVTEPVSDTLRLVHVT